MRECPSCRTRYDDSVGFCPKDGSGLEEVKDSLIGEEVGHYRISSLIGEGGMGAVYLAVHPGIGSRVAVKVLHPELARDRAAVDRFFSEARSVNLIHHENIVNILDLAQLSDGRSYIVMEYLEGESVAARLRKKGPFSPKDAVKLILPVLGALQAAHEHGIIHRDLKPDNIYLTRGGQVKVLDFGIAKLDVAHGGGSATRTGAILGTPMYMSPEQAAGRASQVDHRSDIYSVGVILHELVAGRVPFYSDALYDLITKHLTEPPPPLRSLRADVPAELEAVVLRALAKERDARFPTAAVMAEEVQRVADLLAAQRPGAAPAPLPGAASAGAVVTPAPTPGYGAPATPPPGGYAPTPVPAGVLPTPPPTPGGSPPGAGALSGPRPPSAGAPAGAFGAAAAPPPTAAGYPPSATPPTAAGFGAPPPFVPPTAAGLPVSGAPGLPPTTPGLARPPGPPPGPPPGAGAPPPGAHHGHASGYPRQPARPAKGGVTGLVIVLVVAGLAVAGGLKLFPFQKKAASRAADAGAAVEAPVDAAPSLAVGLGDAGVPSGAVAATPSPGAKGAHPADAVAAQGREPKKDRVKKDAVKKDAVKKDAVKKDADTKDKDRRGRKGPGGNVDDIYRRLGKTTGIVEKQAPRGASALDGLYAGRINNTTVNTRSTGRITLRVHGTSVTGYLSVDPPLAGSGPIVGTLVGARLHMTARSNLGVIEMRAVVLGKTMTGTFTASGPLVVGKVQRGSFTMRRP